MITVDDKRTGLALTYYQIMCDDVCLFLNHVGTYLPNKRFYMSISHPFVQTSVLFETSQLKGHMRHKGVLSNLPIAMSADWTTRRTGTGEPRTNSSGSPGTGYYGRDHPASSTPSKKTGGNLSYSNRKRKALPKESALEKKKE